MSERSDMAVLILGYFTGIACSAEIREHFKIKDVRLKNAADGGPPETFEIEFASGTRVRVRVEDVE